MSEADYLVVGVGAMGMAVTAALIEHTQVSVVMLASDRTAPADLKRRHQPSKDATGGS